MISPRRHPKRSSIHPNFREKDLTFALANDRRWSNGSEFWRHDRQPRKVGNPSLTGLRKFSPSLGFKWEA
jgi:hypothetical protein